MVKTLTFYHSPDCEGCTELKPVVKEIAQIKGWKFREINVDSCKTKTCESLEYVPTIFIGRKKLDLDEMEKLLNED